MRRFASAGQNFSIHGRRSSSWVHHPHRPQPSRTERVSLSFLGIANANVARMVVDEVNTRSGLTGRRIELVVEDSATDDNVAAEKAAKLVQHDGVDVIFGGIYSSTRQAIKGPAVVQGRKLYIYPEQYEGEESDPLIFCTGPVPAQQVDSLIPWLMQHTDARKFCHRPTTSGRT